MQKSLVIVESPAKAKTINKYLNNKYIVKSSIGHVRDLPISNFQNKVKIKKKYQSNEKNILIKKIGIDPYHSWKAQYCILPGKEKIISELKDIANQVDYIYLATDLDREGEAIAWHLKEVIGGHDSRFRRVVFNEITKHSIEKAFNNFSDLNMNRVYAQQARRFMDRIVGYMISPLLWEKISRGLSAGRVQSVVVRIISEREHMIKNFVPEEYWKLKISLFSKQKENISMIVTHYKNKKFSPINKIEIDKAIKKIQQSCFTIKNRQDKVFQEMSSAPFITSTLQQYASLNLGFSVKKTMFLAQKLYEEGYITYMRTDSCHLSEHAIKEVRKYIKNYYGSEYLPRQANLYDSQKHAQEAHEAIRPTDIQIKLIESNNLSSDAQKLYLLIWKQFIASQMTSAQYKTITIIVHANEFKLKKTEKIVMFQGWTKILKKEQENIQSDFSNLYSGTQLFLNKITPVQKFTKPAPRFSEASLVRELEKKSIGRPSTYANIISKIQERGYVKLKKNKFYAEKMGEILTVRLKNSFREFIDYNFTAKMEKKLDEIAENKIPWKYVLNSFFYNFSNQLEQAKKHPEEGGMETNSIVMTSIDCPNCLKKMGIKTAVTGVFLSCSGYTDKSKKRCKKTIDLISLNEFETEQKNKNISTLHTPIPHCQKCNMVMDSYLIDHNLKIHICANNPTCVGYTLEKGYFYSPTYLYQKIKCDKCDYQMMFKKSRFGKFFICMNSVCKNIRKILSNGKISDPKFKPIPFPQLLCKKSDAWFILREGISGIFFAANTFPKSRETRSPLVRELAQFKYLLPEKIHYLADGPQIDNQGNETIVCFNKKNQEHYISSKKEGKFTKWSAFFVDGQWSIIEKQNY